MALLAIGAVLFGAVPFLVLLNDWRLHRKEHDKSTSITLIAAGTGAVCSLASGLAVLL